MGVGDAQVPVAGGLDPFGVEAALVDQVCLDGAGHVHFAGNEGISVALRQVGFAAADLKVLLVRDTISNQDHAVLAVRQDAYWLLLDNRWSQVIESNASPRLMPLFSLGEDGVKLFATRYAEIQQPDNELAPAPASDDISACAECGWPTPFL